MTEVKISYTLQYNLKSIKISKLYSDIRCLKMQNTNYEKIVITMNNV